MVSNMAYALSKMLCSSQNKSKLLGVLLVGGISHFAVDANAIVLTPEQVIAFSNMKESPWYGTSLGREDVLVPPWTPVQYNNGVVSCWGREFSFVDSPFPKQITSQSAPILARPISLKVTVDGLDFPLKPEGLTASVSPAKTRAVVIGVLRGGVKTVPSAPGGVRFQSASRSVTTPALTTVSTASPVLNVRSVIEFDGLQLFEISAVAGIEKGIEDLVLEIPIKESHATYRHKWSASFTGVSGTLPLAVGIVDTSAFIPFYWLGDNDQGLFWFAESDEMWPNGSGSDAIQVERISGEVILRLKLKKKGQVLPSNWKFVFGLQPTPVKPLPVNWRKWRITPAVNPTVEIIWPEPRADSLKYYGYPEAADATKFGARVDWLHRHNRLAVPYLALTYVSAAVPEWSPYESLWSVNRHDSYSEDVRAYGSSFAMVSPLGRGWADFIVWSNSRFLDQYSLDGAYHDNTQAFGIAALEVGGGYLRNGVVKKTYPMMAYRDLYRRSYRTLKQKNRDTFSIAHMSGKVTIPILAYEDAYLDGEQYRGKVTDNYLDVVALDTFRAEFMGRQWGVVPVFLPAFAAPYKDQVEPTRGLMALLMLHDILIWPLWSNVSVVNEALAALDDFGYVNASFIPYFSPERAATTTHKDVMVSAYRRYDGNTLLIIANVGPSSKNVRVNLSAVRFPDSRVKAVTWPTKTAIPLQNKSFPVVVDERSYAMVMISNLP